MDPIYLLDTNIASYAIKGNIPAVRRHLARVPLSQVALSSVTEAELRYGVARLPDENRLREIVHEFLIRLTILPWDSRAAESYAELRATLEHEGSPLGALDTMIASHALAEGLFLVTNDHAFRRVKNLKIEDWTK